LVKNAVAEAMKAPATETTSPLSLLECPDCHTIFKEVPLYLDHRVGEFMTQKIAEVKAPDPEKLVMDCKDGICKMVEEHVEATYNVTRKGAAPPPDEEEEPGLFSLEDDPEDEVKE